MPKKLTFASMCQIFIFISLSVFSINAVESAELRFSHLNNVSGLQQGSIHGLTQDRYGLLWLATEDGLVRYDGSNVVTYRNDPDDMTSIPDNVITALLYGSDGNLWVGSEADGASYYDYQTDNFLRLDSQELGKNIQAFYPYANGLGTLVKTELGIYLIDVNGIVRPMLSSSVSKGVVGVFVEGEDVFVLTDSGQYLKLTENIDKPLLRFSLNFSPVLAFQTSNCQLLIYDINEKFWCVNGGVSTPDRLSTVFIQAGVDLENLHLIDLVQDNLGVIWITTKKGLFRVEGDQVTVSRSTPVDPHSLSSNKLSRLLLGQQGELFVGTQTKGLNITNTNTNGVKYLRTTNNAYQLTGDTKFKTHNEAACSFDESDYNTVWAILKDSDNDLWVGNFSGLAYQRSGSQQFQDHSRLGVAGGQLADLCSVWSLAEAKGLIWIGTWNGLYAFSKKDGTFVHYRVQDKEQSIPAAQLLSGYAIRVLLYDKHRDSLWIGTNHRGLNRINFNTGAVSHYPYATGETVIPHKRIRSLYLDEKNRLWVGSGGGLSLWDEQDNTFKTLEAGSDRGYLSDEDVRSIYQLNDKHLLVGTGNGLNIFNMETFRVEKRFSEKNGLANSTIYATIPDGQGKLLISTANGISHYNPKSENFDNYNYQDGLQSNEFNFNAWHKDKNGIIYFGGVGGLNVIHPDELQTKQIKYPPIVLSLDAYDSDGEVHNLSKMLLYNDVNTVSSDFKNIKFSYVFPSFYRNKYINTSYRIGSKTTPWLTVNNKSHSVDYQNLKPGAHVVELMSSGMTSSLFRLKLLVNYKFWETWWFKVLLSLLAVFITIFITRHVYRSKSRTYLDKMTRQHYQIVEHELRPHLYEANRKLDNFLQSESLSAKDKNNIKENILPLLNKSFQFVSGLRNLIDFKQATRNKKSLYMLEDIVAEVLSLFSERKDKILIFGLEDVNVETHQDAVYLVVKNLISNAIKYSPIDKKIHLKFSYQDRLDLVIECLDEGVGIPRNRRKKIYQPYENYNDGIAGISGLGLGLTIVKFISQTYKGSIKIKDNDPQGCHFTVILKGIVRYEP